MGRGETRERKFRCSDLSATRILRFCDIRIFAEIGKLSSFWKYVQNLEENDVFRQPTM